MGRDALNLNGRESARRAENAPFVPEELWIERKREAAKVSRYLDNVIDLDIAIDQASVSPTSRYIDFRRYQKEHRDLIRRFAWCSLNVKVATRHNRAQSVRPTRVRRIVEAFARFLRFLDGRRKEISKVTGDDADAWIAFASGREKSGISHATGLLRKIFYFREEMEIELHDWSGWIQDLRFAEKEGGDYENKTDRVPHEVLDPMVKWALIYISIASNDLLSTLNWTETRLADKDIGAAIKEISKIPGTNVTWRDSAEHYGLHKEVRCAVTAVYFITGFLSGMRDSEIQDIRDGAWGIKRGDDNEIQSAWVRSRSFKRKATGDERDWIVLDEVIMALNALSELKEVLERYQTHPSGTDNTELLFRRYSYIKCADYEGARHNSAIADQMAKRLNEFQQHVKGLAARAVQRARTRADKEFILRFYHIADGPDGAPWRWVTKHLRRTIAWYIGNEPFGVVAGMRQYGHVRDVTFRGYAGAEESGFRAEVDRQRVAGQQLDIIDMYNQVVSGKHLGGPTGRRLESEFRNIAEHVGELAGKVVDERRLHAMLKNVAKVIYPLLLNDCFFDADKALCLKGQIKSDKTVPIPARCDRVRCPNSAYSKKHEAALRYSVEEAKGQRALLGLSKNQRAALDVMIAQYEAALKEIGDGGQTEGD